MARVPYVRKEELDSDHQGHVVSSLQPGKRVNVYSAVANNPAVLAGLRSFLGALWSASGLTDRQREIVILTTSAETGVPYEWHQHVNIATNAGLEVDDIRAIGRDDHAPFSREEQALIAYTRAVVRGRVTDVAFERVAEHFDEEALVGITSTAAGYLALGAVIEALGVEIEAGEEFVGWDVE